ncbi:MAG: dUTP diphosphatase [Actinomycetia bacterium]|nr:dUTP diphosphatase [Actinomycetes bacterium]
MSLQVPIQRLDPDLPLPQTAYAGDAGFDLVAAADCRLLPGARALIPTGMAVAIPEGYAGFVLPRSGLALRVGLSQANSPGLIDSHYRGELQVVAVNLDPSEPILIQRGERIAQLVILQLPEVSWQEVEALDATDRGAQGFGSSGV